MTAISVFRVMQHSQIFFTFLQKSNSMHGALSITQFPGLLNLRRDYYSKRQQENFYVCQLEVSKNRI